MSKPIAQPDFPTTLAAATTWNSGVIAGFGAGAGVTLVAKLDQDFSLSITRYADTGGNAPIDQQSNDFSSGTSGAVDYPPGGPPFCAVQLSITNKSATTPAGVSYPYLRT